MMNSERFTGSDSGAARSSPLRPWQRSCPAEISDAHPALAERWRFSAHVLSRAAELTADADLPPFVLCLASSGSVVRMEADARSDLDLLVVIDDVQYSVTAEESRAVHCRVTDVLSALQLQLPKESGVFARPVSCRAVLDRDSRGQINESMLSFGHRMQLLTDAQPFSGEDGFCRLQKEILDWYSIRPEQQVFGESDPYAWLRHDLLRYWHSLASRAVWIEPQCFYSRLRINAKLRSTRRMMISAFAEVIRRGLTIDALVSELNLTPTERLLQRQQSSFAGHCTASHFIHDVGEVLSWLRVPDAEAVREDRMHALSAGLQRISLSTVIDSGS